MSTTQPIKEIGQINELKEFYLKKNRTTGTMR